jgi:hypothetical protein
VDRPKEGRSGGNANTDNVVRKALKNTQATARICGVSTKQVTNTSSGKAINPNQFNKFCEETFEQYTMDCRWCSLPPTLDRVLVHGEEIIEATPLAQGATSDEGSKAYPKFARKFLKHHTRRTSQKQTMLDIIDPNVVTQSCVANKKHSC